VAWIWVLLGICALIVLHEGGHFAAAKLVGMRVERFSLFFGPLWLKRTIGETEYGIGVIPLGGYVKITGMSPEEVFEEPSVEARAYVNQPVWKRIVVIAAGPLVNVVVALLIFSGVYLFSYYPYTHQVEVGAVAADSAASGKLVPGDVIVSIDGRRVTIPHPNGVGAAPALAAAVAHSRCAGGVRTNGCVARPALALVVRRDGKLLHLTLNPRYDAAAKRYLIGIDYGPLQQKTDPGFGAFRLGADQMWKELSATVTALSHLYQAKERRQLHSIAGAATAAEQATAQSTAEGLSILGGLSLALAIVNLLPFLPLDGGHIFWALVEKVRGRKVSLVTMERASYVGLALVLCLFAIGFSNDISTFAHGGNFLAGH
jgi:regulator of sigma E protease